MAASAMLIDWASASCCRRGGGEAAAAPDSMARSCARLLRIDCECRGWKSTGATHDGEHENNLQRGREEERWGGGTKRWGIWGRVTWAASSKLMDVDSPGLDTSDCETIAGDAGGDLCGSCRGDGLFRAESDGLRLTGCWGIWCEGCDCEWCCLCWRGKMMCGYDMCQILEVAMSLSWSSPSGTVTTMGPE